MAHRTAADFPGARWYKASASAQNNTCVEVAHLDDGQTLVRDSKNPDGPVLLLTAAQFTALTRSAARGEFDRG